MMKGAGHPDEGSRGGIEYQLLLQYRTLAGGLYLLLGPSWNPGHRHLGRAAAAVSGFENKKKDL